MNATYPTATAITRFRIGARQFNEFVEVGQTVHIKRSQWTAPDGSGKWIQVARGISVATVRPSAVRINA